jgi:YegS/Rv2252/BmrU family lipid kinase
MPVHTNPPYFVIVNPASGNWGVQKKWEQIKAELQKHISFSFKITEQPRHAEEIVQTAIQNGYKKIIGIGGDGLLQEIANGIVNQNEIDSKEITVCLISSGTGNDWIKTSGISKDLKKAIQALKEEKTIVQDLGKITFTHDGKRKTRYCVNFAGVGFDSYVVANTLHLKKYGTIAYLLGMLQCLFSYKKPILKISSAEKSITTTAYMCIAGIGKFGGGGMKLMPGALLDDGKFFVSLAKDFSVLEVIFNIHKLYSGELIHHSKVDSWETENLRIEVLESDGDVYLEADGDVFGTGPFDIEIVPQKLRVIVS